MLTFLETFNANLQLNSGQMWEDWLIINYQLHTGAYSNLPNEIVENWLHNWTNSCKHTSVRNKVFFVYVSVQTWSIFYLSCTYSTNLRTLIDQMWNRDSVESFLAHLGLCVAKLSKISLVMENWYRLNFKLKWKCSQKRTGYFHKLLKSYLFSE